MKTVKTLIAEIKENETLQKSLAEAMQSSTLDAFLAAQGCDASVEAFSAAISEAQSEPLDVDALAAVAGGVNNKSMWLSMLTGGLCCGSH